MVSETKRCPVCQKVLLRTEFYPAKNRPGGVTSLCRPCMRESKRASNQRHHERIKGDMLRRNYGIGAEEYAALLAAQEGLCAICGAVDNGADYRSGEPKRLAVDHCHETKRIRGLLCDSCNRGLGLFEDDPARLERAAAYLRNHQD